MVAAVSVGVGVGVGVGLGAAVGVDGRGVRMAVGIAVGVVADAEVSVGESMGVASVPPQAARTNAITTVNRNVLLMCFTPTLQRNRIPLKQIGLVRADPATKGYLIKFG